MEVFKREDFSKFEEKIRQSMLDVDALSSNLQRAAKAIQTVECHNSDEVDEEVYDEYSSDMEQILAGELADEELVLDIDGEYKKRQNKKTEEEFQKSGNYSDDELRFVIFCIENLAEDINVDPVIVHDALTRESDIIDQYIIPCYETLHTQGKEYIIENLKEVMEERGIVL